MKKTTSKPIYKFSQQEAKRFFQKSITKKNIEGLTILLAPRVFDYGRILVITPRKSGNAPERNLIRRRLKHIFYEDKLYEKPFDCIVIISKQSIDLNFDKLKSILNNVIQENIKAP